MKLVTKQKMQKGLLDKWISALRSGEYLQGTDYLLTLHSDGEADSQPDRYCCLGVFGCILNLPKEDLEDKNYLRDIEDGLINEEFETLLAAINDGVHSLLSSLRETGFLEITDEEFRRYSFEEIADFLEQNVELI